MRTCLFIVIFLLGAVDALAQHIVWAKDISIGNQVLPGLRGSAITSIIQRPDSTYVTAGWAERFGYREPQTSESHRGTAVAILGKNGDTLAVKNLQITSGYTPQIAESIFGELLVGVPVDKDTILNSQIRVYKLNYVGETVWMLPILSGFSEPQITKVLPTPDGGCFVFGGCLSQTPGVFFEWFLIKVSFSGQLEWSQRYNGTGYNVGNNIEAMADGNYLLSGTASDKVWSVVIDGQGVQLSNYYFYDSPNPYLMDYAQVKQAPGHTWYASGTYFINAQNKWHSYLARFGPDTVPVFGGEQLLYTMPPWVSADGGFARVETQVQDSFRLAKYSGDSTLQWKITLGYNTNENITFNTMVYDGYGSAVIAGSRRNPSPPNRVNCYLIKVTNMGLPFDPLSARQLESWKLSILPYPNPCAHVLYFQNLFQPGTLELYDLQGRRVERLEIKPGEAIPMWRHLEGVYLYRVSTKHGKYSGRIVKE